MNNGTGGTAFPATLEYIIGYQDNGVPIYGKDSYPGMTLRDYFAAQAMLKLITLCAGDDLGGKPFPEYVAMQSYKMADAMLAERNKI